MENNDKVLEKAKERGYSIYSHSGDRRWYNLIRDDGIGLELYPETEEFKIYYNHKLITLTTSKCGSFMNDEHFSKFENQIVNAAYVLRNYSNCVDLGGNE